jgi:hypothetical protein
MPEFPSEEWAAAAAELHPLLPGAPGAEGTVTLTVATGPRKEVSFHWRYAEGRAVAGGPGAAPDPDLVVSLSAADAADVFSGRVAPSVAFMRGRLKAAGNGSLLLAVLASTVGDGDVGGAGSFDGWRSRVDGLATS